jgi:hypothetical protein
VFTIVKTYFNSGEKATVQRINGMEAWARFVQEPLVYLGVADPVKSQDDARARDPERDSLSSRVEAIAKHFRSRKRFTAGDVYEMVVKSAGTGPSYPDLFEAFSRDAKALSSKSIGRQLTKDEGRVVGGISIQIASDVDGKSKNYVVMPRPDGEEPM